MAYETLSGVRAQHIMLTVGSLFSGIGGIDLGLQWAGMKTIWFVEQDKFCQKVLAKNFPGVPIYGDIKEVDFTALPRPELLCGGFPCQPVSSAGKKLAQKDDRWLWPEMFRCIKEIKPKWVLLENVTGLLDRGGVDVFKDLASIRYDAEWQTIPASSFGAYHQRKRVFIIAYPQGIRLVQNEVFAGADIEGQVWESCKFHSLCDFEKSWFVAEADLLRNSDGFSREMDRIKALGNAVVPQVIEWIGQKIIEADNRNC